jgi:DNA-binding NarL/FixJ family response regulator
MKVSINILAAAACMLCFSEANAQYLGGWGGWYDPSTKKSATTQTKPNGDAFSEKEVAIVRNALNQGLSIKEVADRLRMKPTEVLMVVQKSEQ